MRTPSQRTRTEERPPVLWEIRQAGSIPSVILIAALSITLIALTTVLDEIDSILSALAELVEGTRRGRVWDVWIGGRPVHVMVTGSPPSVELSAGCNDPEDYAVLVRLAGSLVERFGGLASPPSK